MNNDSDLKEILSQAIETIKSEQGDNFDSYYSQPIRNHYEKHDVSEVFYSSDLSCSFISSTRIGSPFNARSISSELFTPCLCPVSR